MDSITVPSVQLAVPSKHSILLSTNRLVKRPIRTESIFFHSGGFPQAPFNYGGTPQTPGLAALEKKQARLAVLRIHCSNPDLTTITP